MIIDVTTTDVAHGGYCVARHEGVVVFVTGALPGERVEVEITGKRARMWYGRVVSVTTPSPDRIPHVWPLAESAGIGGADLGYVSLEAGRRWKARVVDAQMARIAHETTHALVEPVGSDEARGGLAWRTRVTFQVDPSGRLGMYGAKSHVIHPVDGMPLAHEEIQAALGEDIERGVREAAGGTRAYVRPSGSPLVAVDRVGTTSPPRTSVVETVRTQRGEWTYEVAADGFWQVHRDAPRVLVEAVLEAVGDADGPMWDLYCGAGLFTQPLADLGHPVTAVESSPAAARDCRTNTAGRSVECLTGDVAAVLSGFEPVGAGAVVCDPPRSGAGAEAVAQISRLGPTRVVYVACDPAALARDVALFAGYGYDLASLRAFDLFPVTHHVECVATLVTRPAPR